MINLETKNPRLDYAIDLPPVAGETYRRVDKRQVALWRDGDSVTMETIYIHPYSSLSQAYRAECLLSGLGVACQICYYHSRPAISIILTDETLNRLHGISPVWRQLIAYACAKLALG